MVNKQSQKEIKKAKKVDNMKKKQGKYYEKQNGQCWAYVAKNKKKKENK